MDPQARTFSAYEQTKQASFFFLFRELIVEQRIRAKKARRIQRLNEV
jgi:hypothetical protein